MSDPRPDEDLLIQSSEIILVSASHATGKPQEDALPFAYANGIVYLLVHPGGDAGWYRNLESDRGVVVRVKRRGFRGRAKVFDARQRPQLAAQVAGLFREKYGTAALTDSEPGALLPVRIDLQF